VSLDLASINIQRGRDHAIPTYNDIRQVCGMRRALSFHDFQSEIRNATKRQILSELYSHVDDVDLWVGGLEEDVVEGGLVGPTFRCVMAEQFKRTRNGDRFWYEADKHFTSEQLRQVRKVTLAQIFCSSGDNITKVPEDVFMYNADAHKFMSCEGLPKIDYRPFIDCGDDCEEYNINSSEDVEVNFVESVFNSVDSDSICYEYDEESLEDQEEYAVREARWKSRGTTYQDFLAGFTFFGRDGIGPNFTVTYQGRVGDGLGNLIPDNLRRGKSDHLRG